MGRGAAFSQIQTDGQQVLEEVLSINDHQGNTNPNHNWESISTPIRIAIIKRQGISVAENVEKGEPLCTVGGNVNWCSHYGKQQGGSSEY